ncbi:DUF397 domain-containing protein [Streptomyces sp. NBS 14/10]|uniref:DUF397 domain-containing protein n=1 Tax=Streptomyces sp. NBS 14/10 TaxID=1945643 RepID=UPI000B7E19EF|nr:DUF397 domain-containing protein [Streptomyces sp. NBS 14/10]KAK1181793.1 DUF397 domain-containing protein [Streptomyces sp. NBS 14/10]
MVSSEHTVSDASTLTGWFKSSYSGGNQAECLEVARGHADIPVRDSKAPEGPALVFEPPAWSAFVSAVKRGEFPIT